MARTHVFLVFVFKLVKKDGSAEPATLHVLTRVGPARTRRGPTRVSYEGRQTHHDDLMGASAVNRRREQLDESTA
jgi:hypothetical protein